MLPYCASRLWSTVSPCKLHPCCGAKFGIARSRRVLCCSLTPGKGCKAAGHLGLLFGPTVGDLGLRVLDHDLANFATQDGVRDPGVITRPDCNMGRESLLDSCTWTAEHNCDGQGGL